MEAIGNSRLDSPGILPHYVVHSEPKVLHNFLFVSVNLPIL
ncbi:Uncharacterized protein YR821_2533 [Yersinia ruckeri]|uniref:Uncharacterized protein n=1 Tax=Yersinia ruckeri TaxID=29486 RepID=A0A0A8VFK6_YERRU|nr:hypothetical protein yruck0001_7410 [Yersinia ruckeri ATCC 29473]QTD77451.1 Uncharacterized protein YR821_2533 [Yersinia ruckeri]CEK28360.1 hypothetical protein CSF007_13140 [Yersinia ruckeri]